MPTLGYNIYLAVMPLGGTMSKFRVTIIISFFVAVTGCSSNQYAVTYDSNPRGAQVYCSGTEYGYTPVTLYYTLDEETKKNGILRTSPCSVKWVSGASARVNNVNDLNKFPNGIVWKVPRPSEPNAHVDHSFALQLQQNKQMNRVLSNQQTMQNEQQRVKSEKQQEDNTQYLCNLGLLNHPSCK
jgi:hypothetical protein